MTKYYIIRRMYSDADMIELDRYDDEIHKIIDKCSTMELDHVIKGEIVKRNNERDRHFTTYILSASDFIAEV